jgi:hypothetical protein
MLAKLVLDQYSDTESIKRIVVNIDGYNYAIHIEDDHVYVYTTSFDMDSKNVQVLKEVEIPRHLIDMVTDIIIKQRKICDQLKCYFENN